MKNERIPFFWIKPELHKRAFLFFLVASAATYVAMYFTNIPLKTELSPSGILDFEFSRSIEGAKAMMNAWGEEGKNSAVLNIGLDYLFLISYSHAIGLACLLISRGYRRLERIAPVIAVLMLFAAFLDAVENAAMLTLIKGNEKEIFVKIAEYCAKPKFLLVILGLFFLAQAWLYRQRLKRKQRREDKF